MDGDGFYSEDLYENEVLEPMVDEPEELQKRKEDMNYELIEEKYFD